MFDLQHMVANNFPNSEISTKHKIPTTFWGNQIICVDNCMLLLIVGLGMVYHSTSANLTLIISYSEMLKFSIYIQKINIFI
jgi:hypothetical protein